MRSADISSGTCILKIGTGVRVDNTIRKAEIDQEQALGMEGGDSTLSS